MRTLSESIAEYNKGKLNLTPHKAQVLLKDVKDAILNVYRNKGVANAKDILNYFKVSTVEQVRESEYDLFLHMCEQEVLK